MFNLKIKSKHFGGGGGDTQTSSTIPEWAVPYLKNVGNAAESAQAEGTLGNVAGTNPMLKAAMGSGSVAIADTTNEGLVNSANQQGVMNTANQQLSTNFGLLGDQQGVLGAQQRRLEGYTNTGGYDTKALKDKAILEAGVRTSQLASQHGQAGTLGSARQAVRQGALDAATAAEFAGIDRDAAQQNFQNKMAAEQGIGSSVAGMGNLAQGVGSTAAGMANIAGANAGLDQSRQGMATGAAQAFSNLGAQARGIEQESGDSVWQSLQRYASTIYGNPARQQTTASGGK